MAPVTPPAGGALWTVTTSAGRPGPEQTAQPPDRPQVTGQPRPVGDLHLGEADPRRRAAEGEVAIGLRGAEHLDSHAASCAACREHPDVPRGPAGAGAEHERELHGRITRRTTVRRSPPSVSATTVRKAASTAPLASRVTPTLGRKPLTGTPSATPSPAAVPASAAARPATAARVQPRSARGPQNRRTSTSRATPDPVSPMVVPTPSQATTWDDGTNGTISRSATITSSQPPLTARAEALLRPAAYSTRDRLAVRPYPTSPGANVARAMASIRASAACPMWDWNTRASGRQAPAIPATPSQEAIVTARVEVAVVASKVSARTDSSGKALVAIGTASTAYGTKKTAHAKL